MLSILKSVLLVLAESTHQELARQVRYLKVENEILRSSLPRRVLVTPTERRRLIQFAVPVGRAIRQLATVVVPETLLRWIREERREARRRKPAGPAPRGRRRTSLAIRRLIVKLARETGWGYTRIMGELRKLELKPPARNTVKNILKAQGFDPAPPHGPGTWDDFLKRHAQSLCGISSISPASSWNTTTPSGRIRDWATSSSPANEREHSLSRPSCNSPRYTAGPGSAGCSSTTRGTRRKG